MIRKKISLEYAVLYVHSFSSGIGDARVHEAGQHAVNGEQVSETIVMQSTVR